MLEEKNKSLEEQNNDLQVTQVPFVSNWLYTPENYIFKFELPEAMAKNTLESPSGICRGRVSLRFLCVLVKLFSLGLKESCSMWQQRLLSNYGSIFLSQKNGLQSTHPLINKTSIILSSVFQSNCHIFSLVNIDKFNISFITFLSHYSINSIPQYTHHPFHQMT